GTTRLFRSIENGDRLCRTRQCLHETVNRKRTIEPNLEQTDLLTVRSQCRDGFLYGFTSGAHHDDYSFGVRVSNILKQFVVSTSEQTESVHLFLDNPRCVEIKRVSSL